jgi:PDZ domain-containing protein
VLLLLAFLIGASQFTLPYYAYRPGSVRSTEGLISIGEGPGAPKTYESDGSIGYTTVSTRKLTLFGYLDAKLDPDVEIVPEKDLLGDRNADENRAYNLQLMDTSKEYATKVALEKLGWEVPVSSDGERVVDVLKDSPADGVLEPGDLIVAVDGEKIDDPDDLGRILDGDPPGTKVDLTVRPFAKDDQKDVELALGPGEDPEQGIIGIHRAPDGLAFHFPFEVDFDTGEVGGPSAGLAFTLGLIDKLTPGDLTGGVPVAVTGTINADGTVGQIGGAGQKAAAVRRAGAKVFLVPGPDYADAVEHAGDVKVVKVNTLDEALAALADLGGNADDLPDLGATATTTTTSTTTSTTTTAP